MNYKYAIVLDPKSQINKNYFTHLPNILNILQQHLNKINYYQKQIHFNIITTISNPILMLPVQQAHSNKETVDNKSIHDMISLLKQYQQICIHKQDYLSAEQAKNKIEFLQTQKLVLRKEQLEIADKENMEIISKQGQEEIRMFQEYWDEHLQELIENLKLAEKNLEEQHEKELASFTDKLQKQEQPKMKYSAAVLDLRKHLRNLIKAKDYKQAELVKAKLQNKEKQQVEKWTQICKSKKKAKIETFKKKQQVQVNALRVKAQTIFNQTIKERDQNFEILLKKNRKKIIESGKISRQRLRTKPALLNESRSFVAINKH